MTLSWLPGWVGGEQYHVLEVPHDDVASVREDFEIDAVLPILACRGVAPLAVTFFVFRHVGGDR